MEIILAVVVASAVIFFGALISMGNERQRKAIDGLREQVVLWAVQDLKIKREHLARDVNVEDPLQWLNKIAARVTGRELNLQVIECFENPDVLAGTVPENDMMIVFTPLSPSDIRALKQTQRNLLSQYSARNPLPFLRRNATAYECSVLNCGVLFDLELPLAWKALSGQDAGNMERMWIYL